MSPRNPQGPQGQRQVRRRSSSSHALTASRSGRAGSGDVDSERASKSARSQASPIASAPNACSAPPPRKDGLADLDVRREVDDQLPRRERTCAFCGRVRRYAAAHFAVLAPCSRSSSFDRAFYA